jgi:MoCo/4Fe-4S cofactor protein with predicted Tat translocation signal
MHMHAENPKHRVAAALDGATGPRYWRSLEELAGDELFMMSLEREFPEYADRLNDGPSRRQFLQLMGASLALAGVVGCTEQPQEKIVTYVHAPEGIIPGKPQYFATAMTHDGASVGLLAESHMGRPTKLEGNPLHPSVPEIMRAANEAAGDKQLRFGATDTFSQAVILSLYDPDRSQTVLRNGQINTWEAFVTELRMQLEQVAPQGGRGFRILTGTVVSPTMADQLRQLLEKHPNAAWHQYEPVNNDNALAGSRLAFGADVEPLCHLERADVILSLDADFLADGPTHLQNARGFAQRRKVDPARGAASMNRLYALETSPTLTGAAADHRLATGPHGVAAFALAVARGLGMAEAEAAADAPAGWVEAVVGDLQQARGRGLVLAGRGQPPVIHALAHWMNATLGNVGQTMEYVAPAAARPESSTDSMRALVDAMYAGEVQVLAILGGNPVYDAPAEMKFAAALARVPHRVRLGMYVDETSAACVWHIPEAHFLESWGDARAADGTASIVQPLIKPLYDGKTQLEFIAAALGNPVPNGYELVQSYWRRNAPQGQGGDFNVFWQTSLHDGIITGTASASATPTLNNANITQAVTASLAGLAAAASHPQMQLVFRPDPSVWDGRFANNGWLQELPRPLSKLTWDNAALVSPQLAKKMSQLSTGDVIQITTPDGSLELPVFLMPGHALETITVQLGYGRTHAGRVGNGVGVDVYPLRASGSMWFAPVSEWRNTGRKHKFASTQLHQWMEGRHIVRSGTVDEFLANPEHPSFVHVGHAPAPEATMYPPFEYNGNKWGMSIDQSKCIGCNACVVACQAENNIPIVGKDQVWRGREMHWLRIDHYYQGEPGDPASFHQPMLCQHCELAPCEPVCPVAATTHSDEGLNEMTYNRCVGTRYCSNNCPYKVRRFNFLEYNGELRSDPTLQLLTNPDVTVRSRGVMEKCTYCVQRISSARIASEKEDRAIRDGEIVTACQAACASEAIVFGNLNDEKSEVVRQAGSSLTYSVLGELNTRPRTTYQAVVRNPHPKLAEVSEAPHAHATEAAAG